MADVQPKFKFKKRSKASIKKKQLRGNNSSKVEEDTTTNDDVVNKESKADVANINTTTAIDDDNNEDEDEEPSALTAIMAVERRRKLLGNRNRGVDTANLGKNTLFTSKHTAITDASATDDTTTTQNNNKDFDERLNKSFAGGKLAGSNDMGGDDEDGILAKKHRLAMESYIKDNLNETKDDNKGDEKEKSNSNATATDAEKQMYAELLIPETITNTSGGNTPIKGSEGDVGAGGAMMGGTGIAEVALPIDERIKAMRETERVAMEYERARKARYGGGAEGDRLSEEGNVQQQPPATTTGSLDLTAMVPMNFASGPGKRKRQDEVGLVGIEDHSSSTTQTKQKPSFIGPGYNNAGSSAIPASSGLSVQKSDVDTLGASYSHNFQLHTKEWISRKRDERQLEIDEAEAQQAIDEGLTMNDCTDTRVGFEMSRKIARGEVNLTASAAAASRARIKNEWDNKGRQHQSSDERAFRQFMSKSRNRR